MWIRVSKSHRTNGNTCSLRKMNNPGTNANTQNRKKKKTQPNRPLTEIPNPPVI